MSTHGNRLKNLGLSENRLITHICKILRSFLLAHKSAGYRKDWLYISECYEINVLYGHESISIPGEKPTVILGNKFNIADPSYVEFDLLVHNILYSSGALEELRKFFKYTDDFNRVKHSLSTCCIAILTSGDMPRFDLDFEDTIKGFDCFVSDYDVTYSTLSYEDREINYKLFFYYNLLEKLFISDIGLADFSYDDGQVLLSSWA